MVLTDGTPFAGLKHVRSGKVRELFELPSGELLMISTDRISAFDVILGTPIPDKGRILNQLSAFWFRQLAEITPHHLVGTTDEDFAKYLSPEQVAAASGRSSLVRATVPLPVECVVRGYITGSLFADYARQGGRVHGLDLPDGLLDGSALPQVLFTPSTKAVTGHDETISTLQLRNQLGADLANRLERISIALFEQASQHAASCGLILADTKFEFGIDDSGSLVWIDEALTPDSSRYWDASGYEPGQAQPSFDKQFVRDYLKTLDWDRTPPGPVLPPEVVEHTRDRYLEAYRRLTGSELP